MSTPTKCIDAFAGRSLEAKRNLYKAIVNNPEPFGSAEDHVKIFLREIPQENCGIGAGRPLAMLIWDLKWMCSEFATDFLSLRPARAWTIRLDSQGRVPAIAEHAHYTVGAPGTGSSAAGTAACCRRPRWLYFMLISARWAAYADPSTG